MSPTTEFFVILMSSALTGVGWRVAYGGKVGEREGRRKEKTKGFPLPGR